ncbi:MAG: hypothetical protein ACRDGI_06665 [Candidatus Limnocylindrales bacterium]
MDPLGGAAEEVRGTLIRSHRDELLAQAAAEREVRQAHCPGEGPAGVRRRLGLALVRVGQAVAGEAPSPAGRSHAVRPT